MKEYWTYMLGSLAWGIFWMVFGIGRSVFEFGYILPVAKNTAVAALIIMGISYLIKRRFKLNFEYIVFPILIIFCYFMFSVFIAGKEHYLKNEKVKKQEIVADPVNINKG
ncbi:MAG: hypothetical protein NTZ97_00830 [Candidatus Moranbacteria bacterium]|nr:hypothetical protein [Candidatus Moranbacteria bacterium]